MRSRRGLLAALCLGGCALPPGAPRACRAGPAAAAAAAAAGDEYYDDASPRSPRRRLAAALGAHGGGPPPPSEGERLPGWERWAAGAVPDADPRLFCALLGDAAADLERRRSQGFQGWRSASPPFRVPYVVNASPGRGLGVFAGAHVKKGHVVYVDDPSTYVRIPVGAVKAARAVAGRCSANVVRHALQWCVVDSTEPPDGVLCQVDDGRYLNSQAEGQTASLKMCPHARAMCARRDLKPGDELTEDYDGEELDDPESDWVVGAIAAASAARFTRPDVCPACSHEGTRDDLARTFLWVLRRTNELRGTSLDLGRC